MFKTLLHGDFKAFQPNQKWCVDFTYLTTQMNKKVYNCSIIDLFDRSIVASVTGEFIDSNLAISTVKKALLKVKNPQNIILHSDQGSQFTSKAFTNFCKENNILQSMSRAGKPTDNAPMERFLVS